MPVVVDPAKVFEPVTFLINPAASALVCMHCVDDVVGWRWDVGTAQAVPNLPTCGCVKVDGGAQRGGAGCDMV